MEEIGWILDLAEKLKVDDLAKMLKVAGVIGGAVALFIPLWTVILQYKASIQQRIDENFRTVGEELCSKDREKRLASASKMGIFINKGKNYYDEAIDILVNRLSLELDYNVVSAITGSLEWIRANDYKKVIEKLVGVERNIEIQDYTLKNRKENAKINFDNSVDTILGKKDPSKEKDASHMDKILVIREQFKEKGLSILNEDLTKEMSHKMKISFEKEKEYKELQTHRQVVTDAITIFLNRAKELNLLPIPMHYYYTSLNNALIIGFKLTGSNFERATLSGSIIHETKFDNSNIKHTTFTASDILESSFVDCTIEASLFDLAQLKNVDFSNAEFADVFFIGSDLTGSNFTGAKGLKAIYFYKVQNYDKAIFDTGVKENFKKELEHITDDEFRNYIEEKPTLSVRKKALLETLETINKQRN